MPEFGHFALCLAWLLAFLGVLAGVSGGIKSSTKAFYFVAASTQLVALCSACAIGALGYAFLHDDYSLQYVWQFSNHEMQGVYKISAIWGGMDGSMLLWAFVLSLSGALVAFLSRSYNPRMMVWVLAVVNSSILFFLTVVVFLTNPFRYLKAPFLPPDGNGLNPLLQNPLMVVHPPMLYLGFTTFAVPFAFCLGALLSGNLSNEWIRLTRRWTLVAWTFLTAGIVMGGHWAYVELGWGGFWAWDPVENASFLPWLTGTAYLHSVMVQERKNMLKLWNIWLVTITYCLTVFGTFLTRSGVVQSVHSFAETDVGWVFLVYLGAVLGGTVLLTWYRRAALKSERKIESLLSREAAFLINNLILLSICFATLWGVMFPVLSEALTGVKQTVSIPFFNAVNVPLFLALILMMGIGPLIAWKKASWRSLKRTFLGPFLSACAIALILVWAGIQGFYPILSYSLCFFTLMTIFSEIHRGMKAQKVSLAAAGEGSVAHAARLFTRHRVRYAGYLVHFGALVVTIAITASMAHKLEKEFTLEPGQSIDIGRFSFTLREVGENNNSNYQSVYAVTQVKALMNNEPVAELRPEMRTYLRNRETTTEVALQTGWREDIYLVLIGVEGEKVAFKLFLNPLQIWLWLGAVIMVLGTIVILIPESAGSVELSAVKAGTRISH